MSILWSTPRGRPFLILGHGGACPPIDECAEAQRVQTKHRPRAHGKDVADDSANAGGWALERLNCTWMIVTLDLEGDFPATANIHNAGIFFTGLHQNIGSGRRKFLQFFSRIFVRAVLAPHHGKDSELGKVWFTPKNFLYALKFLRTAAVLLDHFRRHAWIDNRIGHRQVTLTDARRYSTGSFLCGGSNNFCAFKSNHLRTRSWRGP